MGSHRLPSKRKLHQNMLSRCSLMYTQYNFITYSYNISKCFELQFSWSEPCWSGRSGGARNCQGGETINRRARCKHCTKCFVTFVVERRCFCAQVIRCEILWRMYMPIIGNVKHGSSLTPNFSEVRLGSATDSNMAKYEIQNLYCFVYRQKYMETTMQQRAKDNIYD